MVPLAPHLTLCRNALGPMSDHPSAGAAIARRNLLRPSEGRVPRDCPPGGVMRVRRRAAKLVVVFQNVLNGLGYTVEVGHLAEKSGHTPFGARAVVADDVEDQRVVELTCRLDRVDEPADLRVCVFAKSCKNFHLPRK